MQLNPGEGRTIVAVTHDPSVTDYATRSYICWTDISQTRWTTISIVILRR